MNFGELCKRKVCIGVSVLIACSLSGCGISDIGSPEIELKGNDFRVDIACRDDASVTIKWGNLEPILSESKNYYDKLGYTENVKKGGKNHLKLSLQKQELDPGCRYEIEDDIDSSVLLSGELTSANTVTIWVANGDPEVQAEKRKQKTAEPKSEEPVEVTYTCDKNLPSSREIITAEDPLEAQEKCGGRSLSLNVSGKKPTKQQNDALYKAYGTYGKPERLQDLYSRCLQQQMIREDETPEEYQLKYMIGALVLCPKHKDADRVNQAMSEVMQEDELKKTKQFIFPGSYLAGVNFVPGVYETRDKKLKDCYWESSDPSGNIIANNFINISGRVTVDLTNAYGFTSRGCGSWRIVN